MALDHYCCQRIIPHDTNAEQVSDTVEFRDQSITTPPIISEYHILHVLDTLRGALIDTLTAKSDSQLQDVTSISDASVSWSSFGDTTAPAAPTPLTSPVQTHISPRMLNRTLGQPKPEQPIPPQPTTRVHNEPAPRAPSPRVQLQNY